MRGVTLCWAATLVCPVFAGNPYSSILQRNVFGLRPSPAIADEHLHTALPKVLLTGITTLLKGKRALLKVEFPVKPGQKAKEESFILKEGERAGPIEVLEINEKMERVKLNNSGTITNITFERIVPKSPTPSPIAVPKWRGLPNRPTNH